MKFAFSLIILILALNFGLSVDVKNFSCPERVYFEQDFICHLDIEGVSGLYDLKIYITGSDGGINKIWGDNGWTRADWYLKKAIYQDGIYEVKLKIDTEFSGNAIGILRLRENGCSSPFYEREFSIFIGESDFIEEEEISEENTTIEDEENTSKEEDSQEEEVYNYTENETNDSELNKSEEQDSLNLDNKSNKKKEIIYLGNPKVSENENTTSQRVINLNSDISLSQEEEIVYESKSEKIRKYGFYFFIGLLFFGFCYLLIGKLKNGYRNYDY